MRAYYMNGDRGGRNVGAGEGGKREWEKRRGREKV